MKILVAHNAYQQRGGEDAVFAAEAHLLAERGHDVVRYFRTNQELRSLTLLNSIATAIETSWSSQSYRDLSRLLKREKPDIAHFHNTFPLISPSAYYACANAGVPVVQTLHNYRLLCPAATFFRDGKVCESCLGRNLPWPAVVHSCYRDSATASAALAGMLSMHNAFRTWKNKVDVFIALSEFARQKFIASGLPAECIVVKPNFLEDPGVKSAAGEYALYVGRLSEDKGIRVLLSAWKKLRHPLPFKIAGTGPLCEEVKQEIEHTPLPQVDCVGLVFPSEVLTLMQNARFLVFPSLWFEGFPLTIAEAFACGVPVLASNLGAMAEIVEDGRTGLHFAVGDAADLAAKVEWAFSHPEAMQAMGLAARLEYETKYSPKQNYAQLLAIYQRAQHNSKCKLEHSGRKLLDQSTADRRD
ncbi:MAG: glycosyltransferase [Acidobacteriota bacterium]|nr:glycosyltransferase [Acidobacteriota bacterium]